MSPSSDETVVGLVPRDVRQALDDLNAQLVAPGVWTAELGDKIVEIRAPWAQPRTDEDTLDL
jgi:hypothetical protein